MLKVSSSHYYGLDERKQDPRSKHYTDAQVGDAEGLLKSLKWIDGSRLKKPRPRNNHYTDAKVGDAESLFKSLLWSR